MKILGNQLFNQINLRFEKNFIYKHLRNSINLLHETLATTISGLESGEYEKELNEEEYKVI